MQKKLKFNPVITRIKLNPEQAVLSCSCFSRGATVRVAGTRRNTGSSICAGGRTLTARSGWPATYSTTGASAVSS